MRGHNQGWIIVTPRGWPVFRTLSHWRADSIKTYVAMNQGGVGGACKWRDLYRCGYRCLRCQLAITATEGEAP